jgi:kynureninase
MSVDAAHPRKRTSRGRDRCVCADGDRGDSLPLMTSTTPWCARARALDEEHQATDLRSRFRLPADTIYLDGNSLGALPAGVAEAVSDVVTSQWGHDLIASWNTADWWGASARVGDRIGRLIGSAPGQVLVADSTSLNLFKVIVARPRDAPGSPRSCSPTVIPSRPTCIRRGRRGTRRRPDRRTGLPRRRACPHRRPRGSTWCSRPSARWTTAPASCGTCRQITRAAHAVGALVCWDLCHSAGAIAVDLDAHDVDFAVGCGYKYLNGGPGAPAFAYVAAQHHLDFDQPLTGLERPRRGRSRWTVTTSPPHRSSGPGSARPPLLGMLALEAALAAYDGVDMTAVRRRSPRSPDSSWSVSTRCVPHLRLPRPARRPGADRR